jgi:hypothetical protein
MPPKGKKKKKGWQNSDAKAKLYAALVNGDIPLDPPTDEDSEEVEEYREKYPIVASYPRPDLFPSRLAALREQVKEGLTRAEEDQIAFDIYVKNHPKSTVAANGKYPEWEGSAAQRLLAEDIENELHLDKLPQDLHDSRAEYQQFPLKVFRDHIYQCIRTGKYLQQLKSQGKGHYWKEFHKERLAELAKKPPSMKQMVVKQIIVTMNRMGLIVKLEYAVRHKRNLKLKTKPGCSRRS